MSKGTPERDDDRVSIVVDGYGIKLRDRPTDLGEPLPTSVREVAEQVRKHLLRIAAAPTRLVAEILEGATRIVRGISRLPSSISHRLEAAHSGADAEEERRQHADDVRINNLLSGQTSEALLDTHPAELPLKSLEDLLDRYRRQGLDARVIVRPDGTFVIGLGTPPVIEQSRKPGHLGPGHVSTPLAIPDKYGADDVSMALSSSFDASEFYGVPGWGNGYFAVNSEGHVTVHPTNDSSRSVDLKRLVDHLQLRGVNVPVLIHFPDILTHRIAEIHSAFNRAIEQYHYKGNYCYVYPLKVNEHWRVVQAVYQSGKLYDFGLEASSKSELLAVLALADNTTPIVCSGFKDVECIETAMLSRKIGRNTIIVVEQYTELDLIIEAAARMGVRPKIGMRVKLATRGEGRWQSSAGYRSKFGLTVAEILQGLNELKTRGMEDCLQLLHFHLGSQIPNIRIVKEALNEATRVYVELVQAEAGLRFMDVGGGLGVDYDGSQTNFESSVNYTLQEYANDVVYHVQAVCDEAKVPHPTIISESGRAIVAHHSLLVFNVLGASGFGTDEVPAAATPEMEQPLVDLIETYTSLTLRNALESYHDAQQALNMAINLFSTGYLPLVQRSQAESLYWAICMKLQNLLKTMEEVPEDLQHLDESLSDTYFCNFSLFQSMPDSWAIKQLFPIMPIHRLNEQPTRHAVLGDITCDSDGKVDQFIGRRDVRRTLPLHSLNGSPYYLGVFLVGAYQEILGDLRNLYGDTHAVHVSLDADNKVIVNAVIKGDTVREVLDHVECDAEVLLAKIRSDVATAVREGRLEQAEVGELLRFFENGLEGYTYLEYDLASYPSVRLTPRR